MLRFLAVFFLPLLLNTATVRAAVGAQITFEYLEFNKGDVLQGTECMYAFPFQNTGDEPLIISMVKSSCGCLVPYGPRDPIHPGDRDTIWGRYDSKRLGPINKTLTVYSNAKNYESLDGYASIVTMRILGSIIPSPSCLAVFDPCKADPLKPDSYNHLELAVPESREVIFYLLNEADTSRTFIMTAEENCVLSFEIDGKEVASGEVFVLPVGQRVMVRLKAEKLDFCYDAFRLKLEKGELAFHLRSSP